MNRTGGQGANGVVGFGAGSPASGLTFLVTASPFEALPPPHWQAFKRAIKAMADNYGLQVAISEHPSVHEAQIRFWQMSRVQEDARGQKDGG